MPRRRVASRAPRKNYTRRVARYGRTRRFRRRPGRQVVAFQRTVLRPDRQYVKLRSTDTTLYRGNAGSGQADYAFKLNSFADWVGSTNNGLFAAWTSGLNPGFNVYGTLYEKYRVVGVKYKLSFMNNTANSHIINVYPTSDLPALGTDAVTRPRVLTRLQGGASSPTARVQAYHRIGQIYGDELAVKASGDFVAATNTVADPAELVYLVVNILNTTANVQVATEMAVMVQLTRYVVFSDPYDINS